MRQHRRTVLVGLLAVLVLLVGCGGFYYWKLNAHLDDIERIPLTLDGSDRPDPDSGRDVTILLLGSDKGEGDEGGASLADDVRSGAWPQGKYRTDAIMVVHITGDRRSVSVVSIPRDTLTTVYDASGAPDHEAKINDAFSDFGPGGAVATVEQLTDLRMDHVAIIDWAGFKDLSTAVGGVPVHIPETFYDSKQKITWEAGDHLLEDEEALQYVRTRHGLLRGDFDRIERQQNFMRSLMKEVLSSGDVFRPLEFDRMLGALTESLTVDDDWENDEIRSLALSLRGRSADDVTFLTAPVASTPTVPVHGSVVLLDEARTAELFTDLREDRVGRYLRKYPDAVLPDEDEID